MRGVRFRVGVVEVIGMIAQRRSHQGVGHGTGSRVMRSRLWCIRLNGDYLAFGEIDVSTADTPLIELPLPIGCREPRLSPVHSVSMGCCRMIVSSVTAPATATVVAESSTGVACVVCVFVCVYRFDNLTHGPQS